jgi:hypothetical protein
MRLKLVCDGQIILNDSDIPFCDTGWLSELSPVPFDISQIDPILATSFFATGFLLPVIPWAAAMSCRFLISAVRQF